MPETIRRFSPVPPAFALTLLALIEILHGTGCALEDLDGDYWLDCASYPADQHPELCDCDDVNDQISPGSKEVCDDADNDCNGQIDDGAEKRNFYQDLDGDGHGNPAVSFELCSAQPGWVPAGDDCNGHSDYKMDNNPNIYPGAAETCGTIDFNCDGIVGDADEDGDGVKYCHDCDDNNSYTKPYADEICDRLDNDCDSVVDEDAHDTWYRDEDGDGYGSQPEELVGCDYAPEYALKGGDCDESSEHAPDVNPGTTEICDNGRDDNCNNSPDQCKLEGEIPLSSAFALIYGKAENESFGTSIFPVGDFDGDGFTDLLVGVYHASNTSLPGSAYLLYGGDPKIAGVHSISELMSNGLATELVGIQGADCAGWSLGSGDLDDDGCIDLFIGVPRYDREDVDDSSGAVSIVYGQCTRLGQQEFLASHPRFVGDILDSAGISVAFAGDVGGSAAPDLLIGAQFLSWDGALYSGGAYLILDAGRIEGEVMLESVGMSTSSEPNALQGTVFRGVESWDEAGYVSAGAGDVMGEGLKDILFTAPKATGSGGEGYNAGKLYLLEGRKNWSEYDWYNLSDDQMQFGGDGDQSWLGFSAVFAGDVDGDSKSDILAGAPGEYGLAGAAYLMTAQSFVSSQGGNVVDFATVTVKGESASAQSGWSVSGAGDMNCDGYDDILIGAPTASYSGNDFLLRAGGAYMVYGRNFPEEPQVIGLESADVRFRGEVENGEAGSTVSAAGHFVEGACSTLAIGARSLTVGDSHAAGGIYLFVGSRW